MKKYLVVIFIGLLACKDEIPPIGGVASKVEGINSTWIMDKATMSDIGAPTLIQIDVTQVFLPEGSAGNGIAFNSENFTYNINWTSGQNYFNRSSGAWTFDDLQFPTKLILNPSEADEQILDLLAPIRTTDTKLTFGLSRQCAGEDKAYIRYDFEFYRSNE